MQLVEYVNSLFEQGLSGEEVIAKTQEWKKKNQPEEEEVKIEGVVEQTDATASPTETPEASENLESGSGEYQFTPTIDENVLAEYNLDLINQRADRAIAMDADRAMKSSKIVFQDDYVDFDPYGTGEAGKIDLEQRKSNLGILESKPESEDDVLIRQFKEATDLQKPQYDTLYAEVFDNENLFTPVETKRVVKGTALSGMDVKAAMMTPSLQETIIITPHENQLKKAEKQLNELRKIGQPKASKKDIEYRAKQNMFNEKARDIKMNNARAFIENIPEAERTEAQKLIASSIVEKRNRATWEINDFAKELELDLNKFKDSSLVKNFENYSKSLKSKQEQIKSVQNRIQNKKNKGQNITQDLIEYRDLANNYKDFIQYYNIQGSNLKNEQLDLENRMTEYNDMISVIEDSDVQLDALKRNYDKFEKRFTDLKLGALSVGLNTAALLEKASNFMSATTLETDDKGNVIGVSKPSTFFQDEAKKLVEVKEFVANKYYKPVSFKNAFSSLSNFGEYALDQTISQAPIFAAIASGNLGMLAVSASSGGEYQAQRQLEAETTGGRAYNEFNVFLQSLGFGAAEYAFGVAPTSLILKGTLRGASENGKRQILDGWKNFFRNTRLNASQDVGEIVLDAGGEGLTTIFQNGIDGRPLFENVAESVFSGGMFASTFKGAGFFKGAAAAALSDYNTTSDYRANFRMIRTIESAINSPFSNKNDIEGFKKQKQDLLDANKKILENRINLTTNNLNKQGASLLEQSMKRQEELRVQAEALDNNNSIPAEQKKSMLKNLEFEFNAIQDGINNFKKAFTNTFTLLSKSEQGRLKIEATRLLQVDGIQEPSGTQIARKAEQLHVKEKLEQTLESDKSTLKAMSGAGIDVQYKVSDTNKQAIKDFTKMMNDRAADSNNSITEEQAQKYIEDFTEGVNSGRTNGINIPSTNTKTGKTVYDSVTTVQNSIANERSQTSLHELGHVITTEALGVDPSAFDQSSKLILSYLKEANPEAYTRISTRTKGQGADEVLTVFFEEVADGKIKLDKARNNGFLGYLGTLLNTGTSKASKTDYNYNFKGETDIINFAKELGRKLKDGTLTVGDVKTIQEEGLAGKKPIKLDEVVVTGKAASKEAKLSQETVLESISGLLPNNIKTKKEFDTWAQSEKGGKVIADALKPGGPISNYIRSRGTKQESDRMLDDVLFRIYNFNPEAKRKDGSVVGPEAFGEKIFADTAWAKVTARTKLFEESEKAKLETRQDDTTKQLVDKGKKEEAVKTDDLPLKPTETTTFNPKRLTPEFIATVKVQEGQTQKDAIEDKITETIIEGYKDRDVKTFKDLGSPKFPIPRSVAKLYADMFGIKTVDALIQKQRNLQKFDEPGAIRARQFLIDNALSDYQRFPGIVSSLGKSTSVLQTKLGSVMYNKKGKKVGTIKNYIDIISGKEVTLPNFRGESITFNARDAKGKKKDIYRDAQHIKAAIEFHIKNRALETTMPDQGKRIQAGAKFSQEVAYQNLFQALPFERVKDDFSTLNNFRWGAILQATLRGSGVSPINMKTQEGRQRFKDYAVSSSIISKLPKDFWRSMQGTTENLLKDETKKFGEAVKETREFVESLAKDPDVVIDEGQFRGYTGNLPFRNVKEVNEWIAETEANGGVFAEDSQLFSDMLKKENPRAKRLPMEKALNDPAFIKRQENSINGLKKVFEIFQDAMKTPEGIAFVAAIMSSSGASQNHFIRKSAPWKFYQKGYLDQAIREEHTLPASLIGKYLFMSALEGRVSSDFKNVKKNFFQGALLKTNDDRLKGFKPTGGIYDYVESTPEGWKITDNIWARYFNINVANTEGGINPQSIMLANNKSVFDLFNITPNGLKLNEQGVKNVPVVEKTNASVEPGSLKLSEEASTQQHIYSQGVLDNALNMARRPNAPVKKIRVFDFDDTLARSKSKVLYTVPNVEGGFSEGSTKLKAIFMVGGPGAGKTNVGKGLQLGRRGYKVVNQDIALEAMKAESGLPAKESDYTAEQRSTRSKIGAAARKAAVAKFDKYAAAGNGMVIDGTGASYNATTKKIKALQDQGFEVHMVVATTPLETAIERNKARVERSLPDFVVEKTYESVQESLKKYREDFGDRLYEINTETIEYGKPLPNDFLQQVYAGINANKVGKVDATSFAENYDVLESQGAEFDFREFSRVIEGEKGPLFSVAEKIAAARGTDDVFVLTARPADAAKPIQEFMKANGIDIPLQNITGLGDGTAAAKGRWIADKAAEGYNDFYFADDAVKNVQAVKDVLSQVDVKSKVQQAKLSKEQTFDKVFNDIIEQKTGIESYKQFSAAKAKTVGSSKGKFTFFTTPSAEDFLGLLYKTLGKGKVGDAQMAFYKTNLIDPYNRAEMAISQAKVAAGRDYKALKKQFKSIPKTLEKETGIAKYSYQHAIRTYIWDSQGIEVPGLSKRDQKRLTDFIKADPELQAFADQLVTIQKGKPYPKPDKDWTAGNITTDVISGINKVNRAEYLQEWQENVDIIFSEKNMNKLEAAFGAKYVEALKDSLRAMKSGSNRPLGGDRVSNGILDWLNNSVGAIMFLNTRSAVLQTISAVNFINWGDNNILKAGKAFANQKQFWGDFLTLMNSDYLLERRDGLKINVSESEIADAVEGSKNKVNAAISYLLNKGFVFTRYADSFAIASGGATFYRNRIEALVEQGMDRKLAEATSF
jgi:chloramphenicol 3-O-phosphotransferase